VPCDWLSGIPCPIFVYVAIGASVAGAATVAVAAKYDGHWPSGVVSARLTGKPPSASKGVTAGVAFVSTFASMYVYATLGNLAWGFDQVSTFVNVLLALAWGLVHWGVGMALVRGPLRPQAAMLAPPKRAMMVRNSLATGLVLGGILAAATALL